nr:hypothetical protein [Tanacetum cinerariifolium]
SNGSQIKFKDINQIDEDDMEEMDIKWNITLLSMRADKFWKRTGKKISIQGSDVADCKKNTDSLNSKMNDLKSELSDANTYRESNLESIKILKNEVETLKEEKDVVDG